MCHFLSALYLRTGKLICAPQYTDSHSELIKAFGIQERETDAPVQQFVKLELTPPDGFDEEKFFAFDGWNESVDEPEVPEWFDHAARFDAFEQMREILRHAAEPQDRNLIFGGLIFLRGQSVETRGSNVRALSGSNVTAESGSNVTAWPGSNVTAWPGSNVRALSGSNVTAWPGSNVRALSGSNVRALSGSNVTAESGSNVTAWPGSNVTAWPGSNVTAESGSNVTAESGSNVTRI